MASTKDLSRRVQALPQELQDYIQEFTFTLAPDTEQVAIDKDYRPPPRLAINRETRAKFAQSYYENTIFTCADWHVAQNWTDRISGDHIYLINDLYIETENGKKAPLVGDLDNEERQILYGEDDAFRMSRFLVTRDGFGLSRTAVKCPYWIVVGEDSMERVEKRWASAGGPARYVVV